MTKKIKEISKTVSTYLEDAYFLGIKDFVDRIDGTPEFNDLLKYPEIKKWLINRGFEL